MELESQSAKCVPNDDSVGVDGGKFVCLKRLALALGIFMASMVVWAALVVMFVARDTGPCGFSAIYNFGDSNSDTGGKSAALEEVLSPNGETFFKKPSGRLCDGRLLIDFIAEEMGLPDLRVIYVSQYLSPYLDSIGGDFRYGANFATSGASIREGGYSPFHLDVQKSQFIQLKSRTAALTHTPRSVNLQRLASPHSFSKALYIFDIGQNDLSFAFHNNTTPKQILASLPDVMDQYTTVLQELYTEGARNFWIHNTGPIGCLPNHVIYHIQDAEFDNIGCVETENFVAREFNRQLKEMIDNLVLQHPDAAFTLVDMYTAKYDLIRRAKNQGLNDPFTFCAGGSFNGSPCQDDPSRYVSWDGTHYTEASNQQIASRVMNGSLSTPPFAIRNACHSLV